MGAKGYVLCQNCRAIIFRRRSGGWSESDGNRKCYPGKPYTHRPKAIKEWKGRK